MTLNVVNLKSGYRQIPVLKGINFTLESGQILGLIGLNGAGKSTLLKTILGLITPMEGSCQIDGVSIDENHQVYASQIAYIPETPILYDELTLEEHLEMTALGYGLSKELVMERAKPLLEIFRLDKHLHWFPSNFSKGMKQKVMVICALVTDAQILIIDEPFLGLDPIAIRDFTHLLQEKANEGKAIILTTHILSLAHNLCDQLLFLQAGQVIAYGNLESVQSQLHMPNASLEELYMVMAEGDSIEE